jgi:aminoglycoside phosphotransferase (APT) family kinase protein
VTHHARSAEAERDRVLGVLRRHGIVPAEPGWTIELVPGGLNSRVYAVRAPDGSPALTVRRARPAMEFLLDQEERALHEAGADCAACIPPLVGHIPGPDGLHDALLVHRFVPGAPADLREVSSAARSALGACLACIHAHPRDMYTIWPSLESRSGTRRALFLDRLAALSRYASASGSLAGHVAPLVTAMRAAPFDPAEGWEHAAFALLHGDLSVGNILWDAERVMLIDWEYARAGDPAEDLAYLLGEQPLPEPHAAEITRAYIAAGGEPAATARLRRYLPVVTLDAALWWADYRLAQGGDPGQEPEVLARLARAAGALAELAGDTG